MTRHTITTEIEIRFVPVSLVDHETIYPEFEIEFTYSPATPDTYDASRGGPGGWDPGCPAEIEFVSAKLIKGDGIEPTQDQINQWSRTWLDDEGYEQACRIAAEDYAIERDQAAERRAEDRRDDLRDERTGK